MRSYLLVLVSSAGLLLVACRRQPAALDQFAVRFVDDARGSGIATDAVDEQLIARLHRAQKLKIAGQGGAPPEILQKIWRDETDMHGTPEERSARQRERAQAALKRTLQGRCSAIVDEMGTQLRVGALTQPPEKATDDVKAGLAELRHDLDSARVVRVTCAQGTLGLLAVSRAGSWRVVDLFQVGSGPKLDLKPSPK